MPEETTLRPVLRDELLPPSRSARRHLISIAELERDDVERILGLARTFSRSLDRDLKKLPTLRGRTIINLFYEPSTRTSSSFELAAKRLSADVMSIKATGSSTEKGESLKDTALTLDAYDPDIVVIRHASIGAPNVVARYVDAHVVNAGDGKHQHPTQALLDLHTIDEEFGATDGLHVAIVGDVLHSRVARSNIQALVLMGAQVTLVGPPALMPRGIEALGCEVAHDIDAIQFADVVYVLRMQRERMEAGANLRAVAARVLGTVGSHPGAALERTARHAPGADEPRCRDRPRGRRRGLVAHSAPGAKRARRADGRPLRPADRWPRCGGDAGNRQRGGLMHTRPGPARERRWL